MLEQCQLLLQSYLKTETFNLEVTGVILGSLNDALTIETKKYV